ncbi:HNHc domain-containing protein [Fusarium sp. Ph1]|nr:HNHc domain-containing protein [Fusarium sp. Ph1]
MTRSKHLHRADKRLEYAKEIESKIRTWSMGEFFRLSTVHLALFMMAPMSVFQPGRILSPVGQTEEFLHLGVTTFPPLIRHFLEQSLIPQSRNDDPVNQFEKSLCLQRDGDVCVFTGDPNPRVCHVLPPSWGNNKAAMKKTVVATLATRRVWNTLCLNEKVHELWARGSCAFKGIRVQHLNHRESVVVLEFHWMPKLENTKPMVHAELGGKKNDWTKMANTMHQLHASKLPAATTKAQQGLSIPSGKRIDIRMARTEAANFKAMIDLQWACITAAALSGVASPRMLHEYEPYWWKCDEGMRLNVLSWLDNID